MVKIGLTGGMGSGKDTVADLLCKYPRIISSNSDDICRWLWEYNTEIRNKIFNYFGTLDRIIIGKKVFNNKKDRQLLEGVFSGIVREIHESTCWENRHVIDFVIINSPLLIESGYYEKMDFVVSVLADEEIAIERALKRDEHLEKKDVLKRRQLQYTDKTKENLSDWGIFNNGTKKELDKEVGVLYNYMIELK